MLRAPAEPVRDVVVVDSANLPAPVNPQESPLALGEPLEVAKTREDPVLPKSRAVEENPSEMQIDSWFRTRLKKRSRRTVRNCFSKPATRTGRRRRG